MIERNYLWRSCWRVIELTATGHSGAEYRPLQMAMGISACGTDRNELANLCGLGRIARSGERTQ